MIISGCRVFLSYRYRCHWLANTAIAVDIFGMENLKKQNKPPKPEQTTNQKSPAKQNPKPKHCPHPQI